MFQCRWGPLLRRPGLGALTGRPQRALDQGSQTREGEVCGQAGERGCAGRREREGVRPRHPLRERNRDSAVELGGDIQADRARPVSHIL